MADIRRLPQPTVHVWAWQLHAACRGVDTGLFFHPEGERAARRTRREANAKQFCQRCPVLAECRQHALQVHEPYGVWGGLSSTERARLLRAEQRQLAIDDGPRRASEEHKS